MEKNSKTSYSIRQTHRSCECCGANFIAKRSTKRFCSERCRYLAFVSKAEETLPLEESLHQEIPLPDIIHLDEINENPTVNANYQTLTNAKANAKKTLIPLDEGSYSEHYSPFLDAVQDEEYNSEIRRGLQASRGQDILDIGRLEWINGKVLSLHVALLNLLDKRVAPIDVLQNLRDSFRGLLGHNTFRTMEQRYPLTEQIKNWEAKLSRICDKAGQSQRLFVSVSRKQQLIANSHILRQLGAEQVKFSELKFELFI